MLRRSLQPRCREGFRNPAARVAATDIYVFTYALSIAPGERALDVARRCERATTASGCGEADR
jgi:hypothetical protein